MFFIYQLSLDAFKIKSQECCDSCLQFQVLPIWQKWPCSLPPNFWHFAATLKRKKASKAAICNEATPASSKMQQLDFFGLVLFGSSSWNYIWQKKNRRSSNFELKSAPLLFIIVRVLRTGFLTVMRFDWEFTKSFWQFFCSFGGRGGFNWVPFTFLSITLVPWSTALKKYYRKVLGASRFKPWAAGWEARTCVLCRPLYFCT